MSAAAPGAAEPPRRGRAPEPPPSGASASALEPPAGREATSRVPLPPPAARPPSAAGAPPDGSQPAVNGSARRGRAGGPAAAGPPAGVWTARARLDALLGANRRHVAGLAVASILSGLCEAAALALIIEIASTQIKGHSRLHTSVAHVHVNAGIGTLFLIATAVVAFRMVLQIPLAYLPARIVSNVQGRLRNQLFGAFTRASWEIQSRDREGTLQETLTAQVLQATGGAMQTSVIITSSLIFFTLMVSAVLFSPIAAIAVLVSAVLLFGVLRPLNRLGAKTARKLSEAQLDYAAGVSEASRLASETQVFGVDEPQRARVGALIARAEGLFFRTQLIGRFAPALYQSGVYLVLVAGLWIMWRSGANLESLGPAVILIIRAGTYGQAIQGSYQGLRQSLPFIERLQESARRYAESEPPHGEEPLPRVDSLAFRELSFSYTADRPVLKRLSFEVPAGEAIGIVGPSGAGKSTLIQILLQLRLPGSGEYLVNGLQAERFEREDWHRQVAFVPQAPNLIHASVADNIRYFREISDEDVERAGRLARIHDDVMSWPEGYATIVGPRADAVSGGQQQRICLARALAARPTVLVLDEPTSALDPHSETQIQASLRGLRHEMTLFVIAHRMSTLDICDRVMVIVDGELVAFDRIELLERNNPYFRSASMLAGSRVQQ